MTDSTTIDTAPAPAAAEAPAGSGVAITTEQLNAWIDSEVRAGRTSAEQAAAIRAEAGAPPAAIPAAPDAVAQYLDAEGFPAAKAADFKLPPMLGENDRPDAAYQKVDATILGWLEDSRLTKEIGSHVASKVEKVAEHQMIATDAEREMYARSEFAKLERMWRPEKTQERIALARQLVHELDKQRPGLIRFLDETGAGNSATVICQLGLHAERLKGWHGK